MKHISEILGNVEFSIILGGRSNGKKVVEMLNVMNWYIKCQNEVFTLMDRTTKTPVASFTNSKDLEEYLIKAVKNNGRA